MLSHVFYSKLLGVSTHTDFDELVRLPVLDTGMTADATGQQESYFS